MENCVGHRDLVTRQDHLPCDSHLAHDLVVIAGVLLLSEHSVVHMYVCMYTYLHTVLAAHARTGILH